jgi:hypothetical protein
MITLKELAWLIIREASGGDPSHDSPYGERTVIKKIKMHLNQALKVERFGRMNLGDKSPMPLFIYTYENIEVNKDGEYSELELPEFFIDLPHNKGVHMICPDCDPHKPYTRRNNQGVSRHLDCGKLLGEAGWWQEGFKVFLSPKEKVKDKAIVKLILVGPDDLKDSDPLPVTPDMLPPIIQAIKAELIQQPPQDVINDNNKDLVANG